ncbi:MAG: hypothetical protein QY318_04255 [Candidatus Dojkabacteria bacterium]|nr:MAG: hypothetical protein QY318_04255 [Candidatus Dojkabacteria bacterium]
MRIRSNLLTNSYTICLTFLITILAWLAPAAISADEGTAEATLFLSQECPQCEDVLAEMEELDLTSVEIVYLENAGADDQYAEAAAACTLTGQPVPMLSQNDECIVGDTAVIEALRALSAENTPPVQDENNEDDQNNDIPVEETAEDSADDDAAQPEISPFVLIASLVAPILLVAIGYYLITRFKL